MYDSQCPVCALHARKLKLRENSGTLTRIDAREESGLRKEVRTAGLDIDEGFVVKVDDQLYYGAEAMVQLSHLREPKGVFNRLMSTAFRSRGAARLLYPVLAAGRRLLLAILRRPRIETRNEP